MIREQLVSDCVRLGDFADGVWFEHDEEWSCAAHFPEMLRGYASAQSLKKHYYE